MNKSAKALLFVVMIFFISTWQSCTEIRYMMSSAKIEGTVTEVFEDRGRRGRSTGKKAVQWQFMVNGETYTGKVAVAPDVADELMKAGVINVEYLTANPMFNRREGDVRYLWVIIFLACMGAIGVFGWLTIKDVRNDLNKSKMLNERARAKV